jgi:hypothetical protein
MGKDVEECVDHEKMNGSFVGGEESNKLKHERYIQYSPLNCSHDSTSTASAVI